MSSLKDVLKRLLPQRPEARRSAPDPETLDLRAWADLPAYHPVADRAPC